LYYNHRGFGLSFSLNSQVPDAEHLNHHRDFSGRLDGIQLVTIQPREMIEIRLDHNFKRNEEFVIGNWVDVGQIMGKVNGI